MNFSKTIASSSSLTIMKILLSFAVCTALFQPAGALPATHYADCSVLSSGTWVKVAVSQRGVYRIDAATLQAWGFADASTVCVYGKNGYMLPELFSADDSDDLAQIPSYVDGGDLYFYASGQVQWNYNTIVSWEHTNNYYSDVSYYFLTAGAAPLRMESVEATDITEDMQPITSFEEYTVYERDSICMGQTGRMYVGENLLQTRTLSLQAPGVVGDEMQIYVALAANASSSYNLPVTVNGTSLQPVISVSSSDSYTYAKEGRRLFTIPAAGELDMTFSSSGSGSLNSYYLDFIRLIYDRNLSLEGGQLQFRDDNTDGYFALDINGKLPEDVYVWNVSDAENPHVVTTRVVDGKLSFVPEGSRAEYVAFDKAAELPAPQYVEVVENQNLHGIGYIPDMVIVTTRYFMKEAERIAEYHRSQDNMKVIVCDQLAVFNEFSGGTPDATAIRRMMKMFYDRAAAGYGDAPRYLLLFGKGSYNNRAIAPEMHNEDNRLLVTYQSESSTDSRYSYVTDDYFAFLADDSGEDLTSDVMMVGVGRMPVSNSDEARSAYDKLMRYVKQEPVRSLWKNKCCFIGYKGDNNLHIRQIDNVSEQTVETDQKHMIIDKVYQSAYASTESESFVGARDRMYRDFDEGMILYDYMGHAGPQGIDGLMSISDSRALVNKILPIFITATCDVCPFDKDELSFGEELFKNENGGFIALYTTTRTVYTNGNEDINRELLREFFVPGVDGKIRLGDVMRRAKERLTRNSNGTKVSDPNKLKYCLIGDPAMAIPLPSHDIVVESINGEPVGDNSQVVLPANSVVTISGAIYRPDGEAATDFNGVICYEVYDAKTVGTSVETIGSSSLEMNFNTRSYKLAFAADTVVNGRFEATFRLPAQCLQSDGTGLISLYAYSNDMSVEAKGYNEDFVINGMDAAAPDETAPVIDNVWVDTPSFSEGDAVPSSTVFHCDVSDEESGIAVDELSVGKTAVLWLDGNVLSSELSGQYSPALGFGRGSIEYALSNLSVGNHTLTLRVFDNAGNSAERSVSFVVESAVSTAYELTLDTDVVTDQLVMSIGGAVEEGMVVRYVVADAHTGDEVWTEETASLQTTWSVVSGTASAAPGEYLCRAYITVGDNHIVTSDKKIVVLGQ